MIFNIVSCTLLLFTVFIIRSFIGKGQPQQQQQNPDKKDTKQKDAKQPANKQANAKTNVLKPGNQQKTGKQSDAQKEKNVQANAKKAPVESQKGSVEPKKQANTANDVSSDQEKKSKSKKKDAENDPSLALHINLKNFPETEKSATKRLK